MTQPLAGIVPKDLNPTGAERERLFEQSIESFFKVFNASPGGMCIADENSILREINHTYESFFGFSREEVLGHTHEDLGILDSTELLRLRSMLKQKGALNNEEVKCITKSGAVVYCLVTTQPVVLGNKKLTLASFTDITAIRRQSTIITQQNKDILDSLHYARRIQETLFPTKGCVENLFPQSFVLLKPKHIVTGDFYWVEKCGTKTYVAAGDCTGHGVPGALMSVIGFNLISKAVNKDGSTRPSDILNTLSAGVYKTLRQNSQDDGVKDGMDISVISIDAGKGILEFASARQPVYRVRGNELLKLVPDRFPIGIHSAAYLQEFNNQQIEVKPGDTIYLFTDGYSDQFGGPEKKKFKTLQFQKLLLSIQNLSMEEQKFILNQKIEEWKSEYEQIDDIMVIGIKI